MRTKDKFYENLSNFHVSKEKTDARLKKINAENTKRFELKDVKTVEKLIAETEATNNKIKGLQSKTSDAWKAAEANYKLWLANEKAIDKLKAKEAQLTDTWDKLNEKWNASADKLEQAIINSPSEELYRQVESLKRSAEALGLNVPAIAKKGDSTVKKSGKVEDDAYKVVYNKPRG